MDGIGFFSGVFFSGVAPKIELGETSNPSLLGAPCLVDGTGIFVGDEDPFAKLRFSTETWRVCRKKGMLF